MPNDVPFNRLFKLVQSSRLTMLNCVVVTPIKQGYATTEGNVKINTLSSARSAPSGVPGC
jgi:hypothetical protein